MTRRSATTITVQLTLRLPSGVAVPQVLEAITLALSQHKTSVLHGTPNSALDPEGMLVRLIKRETTYL